jgi:ArsR family transcriptional regulator, arsenate/arsenite/antimonite-responsive transcriptional repressor
MIKDEYQEAALILKTLSEPTRLMIMTILNKEDICVCQLAKRLNISHNLISFHFKKLYSSGLLTRTRDGNEIHYQIKPEFRLQVEHLFKLLNI